LANFQKGIKRSKDDYLPLKDWKYFHEWELHTKATAVSHGLSDVLDPHFIPEANDAAEELFKLKQQFMFSVFVSTLRIPNTRGERSPILGQISSVFKQKRGVLKIGLSPILIWYPRLSSFELR